MSQMIPRIVWFDSNTIDQKELQRLRKEFKNVTFHENEESTIQSIQAANQEKILFITSGRCASSVLRQISALNQVDSIFIYCFNRTQYLPLKNEYSKIAVIIQRFDQLLRSLHDQISFLEQLYQSFAILDHFHASTHDLTQESAEFLWFRMAKELIFRLPKRSNAKQELVQFCRQYYRHDTCELKNIADFEENYRPDMVIRWYTQESFIYRMINKALRSQDIPLLYRFSFLIVDLSERLALEHSQQRKRFHKSCILYRAVQIEKAEVDRLVDGSTALICSKGFWSTSHQRRVAEGFIKHTVNYANLVKVIFEIHLEENASTNGAIFADLSQFSVIANEQEVLFDLSTCFTITGSAKEDDIQVIRLKVADRTLSLSESYFQQTIDQINQHKPEYAFVLLLIEMGRYSNAEDFLNFMSNTETNGDTIWIELNLGRAKYYQGHLTQARYHYDRASTLMMNARPPRLQDAAAVLHNIAVLLQCQGNYKEALQKYEEALKIRRKYLSDDDIEIQRNLMNIGACLHRLRKSEEGYQYCQQALESLIRSKSSHLPEQAMCHDNIGNIKASQGDREFALFCFTQALEIQRKIFPCRHPDIAISLQNIGNVYREQGQYAQALESLQQALDIRKIAFIRHHPLIADTLFNLALVYQSQNKHDQAMDYHEQALHIRENHYHDGHRDIAESLISMSTILIEEKKYEDACKLCDRAKSDLTRLGLCDDRLYGSCLHNLGVIWMKLGEKQKAVQYLVEASDILRRFLSKDHIDILAIQEYLQSSDL